MIAVTKLLRLATLLLLLAIVAQVSSASAAGDAGVRAVAAGAGRRDVVEGPRAAPRRHDVADEFAEFDADAAAGRRLQNKNGGSNTGGSGGSSGGGSSSTETSRCNTWCMLKQSLGLTIVGLLLICLSPCLIWKNEGRHVTELRRIDFLKNEAVVVNDAAFPEDENTGRFVHFAGKVSVDDVGLDLPPGPLNLTAPLPGALLVRRTCQIYQKFEQAGQQVKNDVIGAGQTTTTTFTVREDWTPAGPQPATLPHLPDETNSRGIWDELVAHCGAPETAPPPPAAPDAPPDLAALLQGFDRAAPPHALAVAACAHVGGFILGPAVIKGEPAVFQAEWSPLPEELVPDDLPDLPELRRDRYGNLTTVEEGDEPKNGDVLIKYEYAADGFDASFVVQQAPAAADAEKGVPVYPYTIEQGKVVDGKCCGKISDDLGVIWMVRRGIHDLAEMVDMAKQDENALTKVLRVVGWVALVAGWSMIFSLLTTLLSTLPILGTIGKVAFFIVGLILGTVCCCGVTAVAYFRYRPLVTGVILGVVGIVTGLVIWSLSEANDNLESLAPTFAPVKAPTFLFDAGSDASVALMQ